MKSKLNVLVSSLLLSSFLLAACGSEAVDSGEESDIVVEPEASEVEEVAEKN